MNIAKEIFEQLQDAGCLSEKLSGVPYVTLGTIEQRPFETVAEEIEDELLEQFVNGEL